MSVPRKGSVRESPTAQSGAAEIVFVPIAFLLLTALLIWNPWSLVDPIPKRQPIPPSAVDTAPVRDPVLQPVTTIAVYQYRCSECHALIPSPPETDRPLTQHRHIQLDHGINNRCFNCHLRENRNAFADDRGEPIPFDQPQYLCAKCHGPVYRDWTHGVHGRSEGYWNVSLGPMKRRKCIECHDPHRPAFEPLAPAPPPTTLRMGDQTVCGEDEGMKKNPLLIYRQLAAERETVGGATSQGR